MGKQTDMTQGNPARLLLAFAVPLMLGTILQQSFIIVDRIIVGHLIGANAFSAIGATSSVSMIFTSISLGIAMGSGIVVSQYFGAKDEKNTALAIRNGTIISVISTLIIFALAMLLTKPILTLLNTPDALMKEAAAYMLISMGGLIFVILYYIPFSTLRALGDAKTPIIFLTICSVTDSNLNHTGIYLYSKGKIMIHLTFDYQSDEGCTTPGQYLRYHRTFQGLTTRELAEKVGVVPATLVLYENDRHPIKHSTAVALANVLGIDRSRLLDEYTVFVDYPYSSLLKKVRRELSFTQMQMAEVIGIGQTTYSGWEREVRVPRRKEHEKILAAMKKLKVDVDTYLCQPNPL